jgi:hypothetical protein
MNPAVHEILTGRQALGGGPKTIPAESVWGPIWVTCNVSRVDMRTRPRQRIFLCLHHLLGSGMEAIPSAVGG